MLNLVARVVTNIGEANDRDHLSDVIQAAITGLGFDSFNLGYRKQGIKQLMFEPSLSTWAEDGLAKYAAHFQYEDDPLLAYAAVPGGPKIWSTREWLTPEFTNFAQCLLHLGIHSGVTAPLAHKSGAISAITALSSVDKTASDDVATAVYVIGHAGMLRLMSLEVTDPATEPPTPHLADLSAAQIEILEWSRQGKSNGDIALITGRSKRAVAYHMSEILKKLGVSTRAQAVALYSGNRAALP